MPPLRGLPIGLGPGGGDHCGYVEDASDPKRWIDGFERPETQAVSQVDRVGGLQTGQRVLPAGRVSAIPIAHMREGLGFVEQAPVPDPIAQLTDDRGAVVREAPGHVALRPSTGVFEGLRQVPMVERDKRPDPGLEEAVDQALVVVEACRARRPCAGRHHPRPADRKTVALDVQRLQQRDIVPVQVVAVASHVAGVLVADLSGSVGEPVPDRFAFPVRGPAAFDLVSRSRGAPQKAVRKGV